MSRSVLSDERNRFLERQNNNELELFVDNLTFTVWCMIRSFFFPADYINMPLTPELIPFVIEMISCRSLSMDCAFWKPHDELFQNELTSSWI